MLKKTDLFFTLAIFATTYNTFRHTHNYLSHQPFQILTTAQHTLLMFHGTGIARSDEQKKEFFPSSGLIGTMDAATKAKLEEIRLRTPRYLFRAWNNTKGDYLSGGYVGLHTANAIIPLAFRHGLGHSSVYDLNRKEFARMVEKHILNVKGASKTELSSCTASLSWVMEYAVDHRGGEEEKENCYISIIDTQGLFDRREIFLVPDLAFLGHELDQFHMGYIGHGVITGQFHRAMPANCFRSKVPRYNFYQIASFNNNYNNIGERTITQVVVEEAGRIREFYDLHFTLPMTLAILCTDRRRSTSFDQDDRELKIALQFLDGLEVPLGWIHDSTIMRDIVFTGDNDTKYYADLNQFIHLMRAIAIRHKNCVENQHAVWTQKPALKIGGTNVASGRAVHFNGIVDGQLVKKYMARDGKTVAGTGWTDQLTPMSFRLGKPGVTKKRQTVGFNDGRKRRPGQATPANSAERPKCPKSRAQRRV